MAIDQGKNIPSNKQAERQAKWQVSKLMRPLTGT